MFRGTDGPAPGPSASSLSGCVRPGRCQQQQPGGQPHVSTSQQSSMTLTSLHGRRHRTPLYRQASIYDLRWERAEGAARRRGRGALLRAAHPGAARPRRGRRYRRRPEGAGRAEPAAPAVDPSRQGRPDRLHLRAHGSAGPQPAHRVPPPAPAARGRAASTPSGAASGPTTGPGPTRSPRWRQRSPPLPQRAGPRRADRGLHSPGPSANHCSSTLLSRVTAPTSP